MPHDDALHETTVTLDRPAVGGAVGRCDDGVVIFVRLGLPGERVRARVTDETTSFRRGETVEVLERSSERVKPPCHYAGAGQCGGCDLQHASPIEQLRWKEAVIHEQMRRVAKVEREITVESAPSPAHGSRTRVRCAVQDGRLGLHRWRQSDVEALDMCWLADSRLNPAFGVTWSAYEVELRAIGDGDPIAVLSHSGSIRDGDVDVYSLEGGSIEQGEQVVEVDGRRYVVSATSFWQSHRDAPSVLSRAVLEEADFPRDGSVVDLYGGVGLFARVAADAVGLHGRVTVVEASESAARDAERNLASLSRAKVRPWTVTARSINDTVDAGSTVVMDPPRSGAARGVMESIARRGARRVVYVSCDASTLARDIRRGLDAGLTLRQLRAFDLFPMTEHVELVAVLDG